MRILVTGSRDWPDPQPIWDALSAELGRLHRQSPISPGVGIARQPWEIVLVHGAARGADAHAESWAAHHQSGGWPVRIEGHPALWQAEGRAAGILRNVRMVKSGADLCLAFIRDASKGATHCAKAAHGHGIETRVVPMSGNPPVAGPVVPFAQYVGL